MKRNVKEISLVVAFLLLTARLLCGAAAAPKPPQAPYETRAAQAPTSPIDKLVFARLDQLGIPPAHLCSDAVFVRRVYLDVIGTLPTAQEARAFLVDPSPDKRRALIDRLLARPEFADYWTMKWCDLLRVKAEFPINLWPNAVQAYHRYIYTSMRDNVPYNRFVRELLTASGSNFRVGPVNFYRALQSREPQSVAQAVALAFMGERTDGWPKERLAGMAGFFTQIGYKPTSEWKEEIIYFNPEKPGAASRAVFPDGTAARLSPDRDPREVFADWLTSPKNDAFSRNIANRAWAWLFGRGIIQEPDDYRADNPPSNPELLALLQRELVGAGFDLKHLYRLILNSRTYQLSAIPQVRSAQAEANFAYYPLRRLEAEVLIDALCQITGSPEKYQSAIPEPFTFIPEEIRSIALPDGSITSSFLEMFGRPARDTGLESERINRPTAAQRLHLLNSSHIQRKIEQGPGLRRLLLADMRNPRQAVNDIYLTILSRFPTDEELGAVAGYARGGAAKGREAAIDIAWALINSSEFLYRH